MLDNTQTTEPDLAAEFAERLSALVNEFKERGIDLGVLWAIMEYVSENE